MRDTLDGAGLLAIAALLAAAAAYLQSFLLARRVRRLENGAAAIDGVEHGDGGHVRAPDGFGEPDKDDTMTRQPASIKCKRCSYLFASTAPRCPKCLTVKP